MIPQNTVFIHWKTINHIIFHSMHFDTTAGMANMKFSHYFLFAVIFIALP